MRQTTVPDSKTKAKLIEAAEELLSEVGFDAVSVRDITTKAGTNVAAVNYHFGGRDALLALIAQRHVAAVNEERLARLEVIESAGGTPALEDLVEAWLQPVVAHARKGEFPEKILLRLIGRLFGEHSGSLPPSAIDGYKITTDRFNRSIETIMPELDPIALAWRIHYLNGAMSQLLTQEGALLCLVGEAGNLDVDEGLAGLVHFAAAGLRAALKSGNAPVEKLRESKVEGLPVQSPVLELAVTEPVSVAPMPVHADPVGAVSVVAEPVPPESAGDPEETGVVFDERASAEEPKATVDAEDKEADPEDVPELAAKPNSKKSRPAPQPEFLF
jgi:AcrR family transcriptional regulator